MGAQGGTISNMWRMLAKGVTDAAKVFKEAFRRQDTKDAAEERKKLLGTRREPRANNVFLSAYSPGRGGEVHEKGGNGLLHEEAAKEG